MAGYVIGTVVLPLILFFLAHDKVRGNLKIVTLLFALYAGLAVVAGLLLFRQAPPPTPPTNNIVSRPPTFRRAMKVDGPITIAFGGMEYHTAGGIPMLINGQIPFSISNENGRLMCDVRVYAVGASQIIVIEHNVIQSLPDGWDCNSNDNGMEIVNAEKAPMFQMYYEGPYTIRMQGAIVLPPFVLLAKGDGLSYFGLKNPNLPTALRIFKLDRFFKYPSAVFPRVPN